NPEVFVHRIGRTARAGRSGAALLLLLPHEDAYEAFLRNRRVPLCPFEETQEGQQLQQTAAAAAAAAADAEAAADEQQKTRNPFLSKAETDAVNDAMQLAVQQDQALIQKGARAFVSFIRAYKEHQLSFLLPYAQLDLGKLGTALRLLRLPRMREVVGKSLKSFVQSPVDPLSVPYKYDLEREQQRQQQLQQLRAKRQQQQKEKERKKKQQEKASSKPGAQKKQKRTTSEKRRAKKRAFGRRGAQQCSNRHGQRGDGDRNKRKRTFKFKKK
ncbi:RNA helicase, putative, partial [Eimeria tenella]